MSSIARKGSGRSLRWHPILELGRDENGKRVQRWLPGHKRKKDAQRALDDAMHQLRTGSWVEPSDESFGEYARAWLKGARASRRQSSVDTYAHRLKKHVLPSLGFVKLQKVTPAMLSALYSEKLDEGLSIATVRGLHVLIRRVLEDAVREDRVARNAADRARPPRAKDARLSAPPMAPWSEDELRRFFDFIGPDDKYFAVLWLLAFSGMRRGEALALSWDRVDLDAGHVVIDRALTSATYRGTPGPTKTGQRRAVHLDRRTVEVLRVHRARQAVEDVPGDLCFCHDDGRPFAPEGLSREFVRRSARAGLRTVRLHDLRHGWATMALSAGIHPRVVQENLGHSSITTTLGTYSHATKSLRADAAATVSDHVFGRPGAGPLEGR